MPEPSGAVVEASSAVSFLTFRVGERRYALPAEDVVELIRVPAMTRVPQSPAALLGIANLRGAVLPVASLRGLLGMDEAPLQASVRAIVLNLEISVAVVIDAVDSLVEIAPDQVEMQQTELSTEPGERLNGSFQIGNRDDAVKILDVKGLLDTAFTQRVRAERQVRRASAAGYTGPIAADVARHEMIVTFEVAGQEFALDLEAVQEVLPAPAARTAVPKAEALVLGVTALRGALLPLLSLRTLLGFPVSQTTSQREKVIVMNVSGATVGLVADRARSIVAADQDLIDPVPAVLAARMGGETRIRAIYRGDAGRRLISILAPEQLFREDVMQRLRAHRDQKETQPGEVSQKLESDATFLVFRLGEDEFALPIDAVDEIAQVPTKLTRVPKAPKFLEGVVNLRGAVLPVIDLRRRFDMAKSQNTKGRRLVVARTERHRAGMIVDSVSDVLRIPESTVEPAPNLTDDIARLVKGVINLEGTGRIILLLDPPELLTRTERGLLDTFQADQAQAVA